MSLLVSSASWLIICVTSHYKAGRNIANPVNVKFPNLIVIKEEEKGREKRGKILNKGDIRSILRTQPRISIRRKKPTL